MTVAQTVCGSIEVHVLADGAGRSRRYESRCAGTPSACQRNGLNNTRRIDAATATLDSQIDWAEQNDPVVADVMIRVELNLGSELLLGGEVSRVDVNRRGGYSAILLDRADLVVLVRLHGFAATARHLAVARDELRHERRRMKEHAWKANRASSTKRFRSTLTHTRSAT